MNNIFTKAAVVAIIGHAATVEQNNRRKITETKFSPGSGDDVIADHVVTGDILIFNRRWYEYHLPTALMIKLYQMHYKTDYDHCAVVVRNEVGIPYVYEKTPFGGAKYRPFEDRTLHAKSHSIVVLTLLPRLDLSTAQKTHNRQQILDEVKRSTGLTSGEAFSFVKCLFASILNGKSGERNDSEVTSRVDMNARFVLDTYRKIGITPLRMEGENGDISSNFETMTLKDIIERKVVFQASVQVQADDVEGRGQSGVKMNNGGDNIGTKNNKQQVAGQAGCVVDPISVAETVQPVVQELRISNEDILLRMK